MIYQLNNAKFAIKNEQLLVNNQPLNCNKNTYFAVVYFLSSENKIITKDELMSRIWGEVIVSDDSIFKLISQVRKIFIEAGLPDDTIINVYGKGYQVKVKVKVKVENINQVANEKTRSNKGLIFTLLISSILIASIFLSNYFRSSNNVELPNYLTKELKQQVTDLQKQDWEQTLEFVNALLTEKIEVLSKSDFAYLYSKKGEAELYLHNFDDALVSLNHAILLNSFLKNNLALGNNYLVVAEYYNYFKNRGKRIDNIERAIQSFTKANNPIRIIDAQLELAYSLKLQGQNKQAIEVYEKIISITQKNKDKQGQMLAINNMAATYRIMNDSKSALKYGEQGLQMCLELGDAQSIANSYSFLSSLNQENYHTQKAVKMIEMALKFQIKVKNYNSLAPKLLNLSYLLVQTYQFNQAEEVLNTTLEFAKILGAKSGTALINLYLGMNQVHQKNWQKAQEILDHNYDSYKNSEFIFKKPMTMAYLALVYYFNNHQIKANELAMEVIHNSSSDQQAKAIASLALAHTYNFMENQQETAKWINETEKLLNKKWLFEYQLFLVLQHEIEKQKDSDRRYQIIDDIKMIQTQMLELSQKAIINTELYVELIQYVKNHIKKLKEQKKS